MARRTKQDAEETREKILSAALNIIYEKGYARSTFVDIAKAIQLSKGAVYWHFKNKTALSLALGEQAEKRIDAMMKMLWHQTNTLVELKEALYEMILLIAEDDALRKYYTIIYYRMEWTEELLSIKAYFDEQEQLMETWMADVLRQSRLANEFSESYDAEYDIDLLAKALNGLVGGLIASALSGKNYPDNNEGKKDEKEKGNRENNATISKVVETGLTVFFRGIQA